MGGSVRGILLAAVPLLLTLAAPISSKADAVGAAFGAGTGLVVAGPPGAVVGSAALSALSGGDRFGDRRIVLTHAGSIIPSTGIAGITPVDGIIIKLIARPDFDNRDNCPPLSAAVVCRGTAMCEGVRA